MGFKEATEKPDNICTKCKGWGYFIAYHNCPCTNCKGTGKIKNIKRYTPLRIV